MSSEELPRAINTRMCHKKKHVCHEKYLVKLGQSKKLFKNRILTRDTYPKHERQIKVRE